jgi:acyl-CoA dehydrogenase
MINLELPEEIKKDRANLHQLANDLFRPIARKYDEAEHENPTEMEVLRQFNTPPRRKSEKTEEKSKKKPPKTGVGPSLQSVIRIEELCWGDCGLTLSWPGRGLGNGGNRRAT